MKFSIVDYIILLPDGDATRRAAEKRAYFSRNAGKRDGQQSRDNWRSPSDLIWRRGRLKDKRKHSYLYLSEILSLTFAVKDPSFQHALLGKDTKGEDTVSNRFMGKPWF